MRAPPLLFLECVEDPKCLRIETHGKPGDGTCLGGNEAACAGEKFRNVLFLTGPCLEFHKQSDVGHDFLLLVEWE